MKEQEPTMVSPAALAETGVVEVEPTAWSETEELEPEPEPYDNPARRNWLISGVIFAATAAVAGLAAGGAYVFMHRTESPVAQAPATTTVVTQLQAPPVTVTTVVPTTAPPPKPLSMAKYDELFLASMRTHAKLEGAQITDPDVLVYRAHQTCAKLQSGYTDGALAQQLIEEFGLTATLANALVRTAMLTYPNCP